METVFRKSLIWMLVGLLALPWSPLGPAETWAQTLKPEEIDALVAPIALYPDDLLSQIFMASTYPLEVVQASRWARQNQNLKGDALAEALNKQDWDPSVKSLVNFPEVLSKMSDKLDWTQKLGDAFLEDQKQVMDAVQRLRAKAQAAGNLQTTEQQKVIVEEKVIKIESPSPQVVYVPTYNPTVVYGAWPYPAYPPYPWYPPGYAFGASMLAFGTGVALGAAWGFAWGGANWGRGDVDIDVNRNTNFNTNINREQAKQNLQARGQREGGSFQHDPSHRKGVGYRDNATAQKFNRGGDAQAIKAREDFRGRAESGRQELARQGGPGDRGGLGEKGGPGDRGGLGDKGGLGDRGGANKGGGLGDRGGQGLADRGGGLGDRGGQGLGGGGGAGSRGGREVKGVGEQVPSRASVEVVMRGAPVLAVPQAVVAAQAEEEVVVPVEVAAVGAVVAVAVVDAGKKRSSFVYCCMIALEEKKMGHLSRYLGNLVRNSYHCLVLILIIVLAMGSAERALGAAAVKQKTFSTPEEGVKALIDAARKDDTKGILEILGADAKSIIESGDPVADNEGRERFVKSYDEANKLVKSGETEMVLEVGKDEWPFPIPLVKGNAGWYFDTQEGKEELINRRIGRNELDVIQVCLAIVDAEREYYQRDPDGDKLLQYAQKLISTKGKRDGLYWETKPNEQPSPLGSLVAQARAEGYKGAGGKPVPYHGYYYKLLTGQGKDAPGGAYDYLVRGKMIGGFGVVAYPAQYGSSGIMTFIVNHDGVVYQKDLGPKTASIAQSMTKFNPDKTWTPVKE